jgi:hypothetical protein
MASKKLGGPTVVHAPREFNPLDPLHLGESVERAMLRQKVEPLPPAGAFDGSGIYAIYYTGSDPVYRKLARANAVKKVRPIYVGKAVPKGSRKGSVVLGHVGPVLHDRLSEHAESLRLTGFTLSDFTCRYLVTPEIFIRLGETLLIRRFNPVWNIKVDGFGNHAVGKGRTNQKRSPWDELHPGRPGGGGQQCKKSRPQIIAEVAAFL